MAVSVDENRFAPGAREALMALEQKLGADAQAAEAAAKEAAVSKDDVLNLAIVSTQTGSVDATEEKDGANEVDITMVATALDGKGKVTGMATDSVVTKILFDTNGVAKNKGYK